MPFMEINMKQVVCVVFILTFRYFCTAESDSCEPFELKSKILNKQLVGHMVAETSEDGLNECVKLCMSLSVCKSTDYSVPNKTCKMNDVDRSSVNISEFRPLNGAIFSDISDWPSVMVASCGSRPCAKHQRCIHNKESFFCIDIRCQNPSIANGKVMLSAPGKNRFLDTATVQCWNRYRPLQPSVKCNASGEWEQAKCLPMTNCQAIRQKNPDSVSGVYDIMVSSKNLSVYCDMDTHGGGWTVFQRRFDGSTDFYRNFKEYENGFGSVDGEFWLGLKHIKKLAERHRTELRIDMSSEDGKKEYELFQDFSLTGQDYNLTLGSRSSSPNAGPIESGMFANRGIGFSTYDHDVDSSVSNQCAVLLQGGWWFKRCTFVNLNGKYFTEGTNYSNIDYTTGLGHRGFAGEFALTATTMMIRKVYT